MPYSPTYVFTAGETLTAEKFNTNVQTIADFFNEGIATADIENASVTENNIMRPALLEINADAPIGYFESSVCQSLNAPAMDVSHGNKIPSALPFSANGFTSNVLGAFETNSATYASVNKSGFTLLVPHQIHVLNIVFTGEVMLLNSYPEYDANDVPSKSATILVRINGTAYNATRCRFNGPQIPTIGPIQADHYRSHFTTHLLLEDVTPGLYNIELASSQNEDLGLITKLTGYYEAMFE